MKKIYLLFTFLCASILGVFAQSNEDILAQINLPSCAEFIANHPCPTKATDLEAWNNDSISYFKLKEAGLDTLQKESEIIIQKNWDSIWANLNEQYYFVMHRLAADSVMNAPLIDITWNSPITLWDAKKEKDTTYYRSVQSNIRNTSDFPFLNALEQLCEAMKSANTPGAERVRLRPFVYFEGWYGTTHYLKTNQKYNNWVTSYSDSYPSGHGYFRGLFGKCMEIVDPEHNVAIQDMLDEWLHCRLQKGAHWSSDLHAGKTLGKMAFDSAMTVEAFRTLVFEAREELKNYRGELDENPESSEFDENIESKLEDLLTQTKNLTINRTLYKDGYFNTLCLPFSLASLEGTPLEGGDLYEFVSATVNGAELQLNIQPVNAIVAGNPYLIRWDNGENIYSMTFNDVTITASTGNAIGEGVQFVGTMGQSELTAGEQHELFLGANNTLYWPSNSNKLKGFRAYFLVSGDVAPHGAPARIVMRNNSTTGVEAVGANIYCTKHIENGRLYIIKNGVRYNAQGQMIK